ncbi:MAG: hypothetical protein ACK4ND_09165 [Cytophagaceae bacterium]
MLCRLLVHIPDLEKAISELSCCLKHGGTIAISESNMHSLHSTILRKLGQIIRKDKKGQ